MTDAAPHPVPPTTEFLRTFFKRDRFATGAGVRLEEARPGYARASMKVRDAHLNGADVVQGGAVFTLADLAFAVACNSHGTLALAVDVTISFLRPTRSGTLVAEAFEVARSRRLSRCEVKVVDAAGEPVALFHGTAFVKDESLADLAAGMGKARGKPARRGRR
jgi:acyl-CoA thioesterase